MNRPDPIIIDPSLSPAQGGAGSGSACESTRNRVRMEPDERVNMILDGALSFFAQNGFNARTRDLASYLGVSQALIYHYFTTKEQLIDRIFERTLPSRQRIGWHALIANRETSIRVRLKAFYASYLQTVDDNDRIRMVMFCGLEGSARGRLHLETQVQDLLRQIAIEIAAEFDSVDEDFEPGALDMELVWHLHSTFIYYLVRKSIFKVPVLTDTDQLINMTVDHFMTGVETRYNPAPAIAPQEAFRAS